VHHFTINSLMNMYDESWNEQVVRQVFSSDIADKILRTPLHCQVEEDKIIWKAERHGRYSVRSAYRLCVAELVDSSHLWRPGYWSGIWNLKVPPKVKNLVWRMCRGCLPTRVRLLDKGVTCPTNCASCDSQHEDLYHVFFACPFAIQVWNRTGLWGSIQHSLNHNDTAVSTIFSLLQTLSAEFNQRLAAVFWSIWKHRNLRVWEDVMETGTMVVERAHNLIVDWQLANSPATLSASAHQQVSLHTDEGASSSRQHHDTIWQAPLTGRYKCNIDAAFSSRFNRTGIGICIRDSEGIFVLARTVSFPYLVTVDVGEAMGLYAALQWVADLQLDNVDFAMDSKLTIEAFLASRNDLSEFGNIISSCRSLFSSNFVNSRVEFTRRQANGVAHSLAREATLRASPVTYFVIPNCIESLIINEML
jgi:ribonuclease HI